MTEKKDYTQYRFNSNDYLQLTDNAYTQLKEFCMAAQSTPKFSNLTTTIDWGYKELENGNRDMLVANVMAIREYIEKVKNLDIERSAPLKYTKLHNKTFKKLAKKVSEEKLASDYHDAFDAEATKKGAKAIANKFALVAFDLELLFSEIHTTNVDLGRGFIPEEEKVLDETPGPVLVKE